jgi:hypothetical protein
MIALETAECDMQQLLELRKRKQISDTSRQTVQAYIYMVYKICQQLIGKYIFLREFYCSKTVSKIAASNRGYGRLRFLLKTAVTVTPVRFP